MGEVVLDITKIEPGDTVQVIEDGWWANLGTDEMYRVARVEPPYFHIELGEKRFRIPLTMAGDFEVKKT